MRPSILGEAKKAGFQPSYFIQIIIFVILLVFSQLLVRIIPTIAVMVKYQKNKLTENVDFFNYLDQQVFSPSYGRLVLYFAFFMIIVAIFYCRFIEGRSLYSMGFARGKILIDYMLGFLIGFVLFAIAFVPAYLFKGYVYQGIDEHFAFGLIILFLLLFMIQAMGEEVFFRGYFMMSLANSTMLVIAVVTTSLANALLYLLNDGITPLAIFNIFLFGVFASILMIRSDSIWSVCAMHGAWNFAQANVFGLGMPGVAVNSSIFKFNPTANTWLGGGGLGLMGSITVTIVFIIAIVLVVKSRGRVFGIRN